ncbi:MAG: PH domain-containing protein [Methanomassiliicoccales archaeon]|nr:PH domain-containing protein [Methanomassiliicoccales archaeon]
MVGPQENEVIEQSLENVDAAKGMAGLQRKYDVFFTNNGIAMLVVEGAAKVGVSAGPATHFINKAISQKRAENTRVGYQGMSLKEMLAKNDKSVYFPYSDVKSISLKKSLMGAALTFEVPDSKYNCRFSKEQMGSAERAIADRLAAKVVQ